MSPVQTFTLEVVTYTSFAVCVGQANNGHRGVIHLILKDTSHICQMNHSLHLKHQTSEKTPFFLEVQSPLHSMNLFCYCNSYKGTLGVET